MDGFVYKLSSISSANLVTNVSDGSKYIVEDVDFFNPEWKSSPYHRATKCEYCRRTVFAWDKECPGCGAPNDIYVQSSS